MAVGFNVGWCLINSSMAVPKLTAVSPAGSDEFRRRRMAFKYFVDSKTLNNFSNGLQSINALRPRSLRHNAEKACGKCPRTSLFAGTCKNPANFSTTLKNPEKFPHKNANSSDFYKLFHFTRFSETLVRKISSYKTKVTVSLGTVRKLTSFTNKACITTSVRPLSCNEVSCDGS